MTWLLRSLRWWPLFGVAVLLGAYPAFGGRLVISVPAIGPGVPFEKVPTAALIPLVLVLLIGAAQHRALPRPTADAVRPVHGLVQLLGLGLALGFLLPLVASLAVDPPQGLWMTVRNLVGYLALLHLGQLLVGLRRAGLVPVVYVFVGTLFGRGPGGEDMPWAWPVAEAGPGDAGFAALGLAVVLIASWVRHAR